MKFWDNQRQSYDVISIFTARAYARAVLGVVILSVCLSVCPSVCLSHAWIVTNLNGALQISWYHTKGQSLCCFDTKSGWWATPLPSEICAQWPTPFKKRRLRQISAYNVSTVRDSETKSNYDDFLKFSLKLTPLKSLIELVRSLCHSWATRTKWWRYRRKFTSVFGNG